MAGRGDNSHYGGGYDDETFPSDPTEWFYPDGRQILDIGPPSHSQARSQGTGRGTPMSQTVGGARSSGDYLALHFGATEPQQFTRAIREDREDRAIDSFEDAADSSAWRNTYNFVQDQVRYSGDYPEASELRTPPSTNLYSPASGSGSGSGSGSAGAVPQAESSRAAHIIPGQPTYRMEIEDPEIITYPPPVARGSHRSSTRRHAVPSSSRHGSSTHERPVQAPHMYDTYPEQQYVEEQYLQDPYIDQYEQQYPQQEYLQQQDLEQQDLEQQDVAPHRHRHRTSSSGGHGNSDCCVIL